MKLMEEEDEKEQAELRARIKQLETEVDKYGQSLLTWREKYDELEYSYSREVDLRKNMEKEIKDLRGGVISGTETIRLPSRNSISHSQDLGHNDGTIVGGISKETLNNTSNASNDDEVPMGCGGCSINSRCECIEQAFDLGNISADLLLSPSKRPPSPLSIISSKRSRQDSYQTQQGNDMNEIDFTPQFSRQQPTNITESASTSSSASIESPDPCGFCQDNTLCICAQMAAEVAASNAFDSNLSIERPDPTVLSMKQSPTTQGPRPTGPGTCAQCLASPTSALFCKLLAASRSNPPAENHKPAAVPPDGTSNILNDLNQIPSASLKSAKIGSGSKISCADTFVELSKHPAFDRASEELGTWVPQLATVTGGVLRTAFEVDAASVMGVLKFFDRRFGRDK